MMKIVYSGFILAVLFSGFAGAQSFKSPDLLIDSKLDYNWSNVLVKKFRLLLKNYKMEDPFKGRFPGQIMVNEAELGEYLPESSKILIKDFGNAVGLNVLKAETKVSMHGFSYDIKDFKTDLKASEMLEDGLVIGTDFSASEIKLSADKVTLSLVIPGKSTVSPVFQVDIIRPVIRATEERLMNFFTKIQLQDKKDHFKLKILQANFDNMAEGLVSHPETIDFNYEKIVIPQISLKIGNKTIHFSKEKIESIIFENHEAIKGLLLAQVANTLKSNTTAAAFKVLEQYKMTKEFWLSSAVIKSKFELGRFSGSNTGAIQIESPADFCTTKKFELLKKDCVNNKVTQTAPSRLTKVLHQYSQTEIKELVDHGEASIVASISEDYLNKLLVTTYDSDLWNEALESASVTLGPKKVILRLDKKGDTGTLIMDVVYAPSKMEKLITGTKTIRFPLVIDISIRIEKKDETPVVIIRLNEIDTTDKTIIEGRPQDNVESTVKDIPRFKNKVVEAIREKLSNLKNRDILELPYPEFKDLGLDKVDFFSDGNGRMNATMKLEDLLEDNGPQ